MCRVPSLLRVFLTITCLVMGAGGGRLVAAPDDAGATVTPPFTAQELAQGYSNHQILALPLPIHYRPDDPTAAEELAALEQAAGYAIERIFDRISGLRVLRLPAGKSPPSCGGGTLRARPAG